MATSVMPCDEAKATLTEPVGGCGKLNKYSLGEIAATVFAAVPLMSKSEASTLVTAPSNRTSIKVNVLTTLLVGGSTAKSTGAWLCAGLNPAKSAKVTTQPNLTWVCMVTSLGLRDERCQGSERAKTRPHRGRLRAPGGRKTASSDNTNPLRFTFAAAGNNRPISQPTKSTQSKVFSRFVVVRVQPLGQQCAMSCANLTSLGIL